MSDKKPMLSHGGNIYGAAMAKSISPDKILDFSANINPLGPPEWLRQSISATIDRLLHYPDPECTALVDTIAAQWRVDKETVVPANGTTELLYQLPRVIEVERALIAVPSYIDYKKVMDQAEIPVEFFLLDEEKDFTVDLNHLDQQVKPGDIVFLASPNNPTGTLINPDNLRNIVASHSKSLFLLDEAFLEFVESRKSLAGQCQNCITLHSLTKFYGIPGLRLGFGIFPPAIAHKLKTLMPPWSVNTLAQEVGVQCLEDSRYQHESRKYLRECKESLEQSLASFQELTVYPSAANYLLLQVTGSVTVEEIRKKLYLKDILIRPCENYENLGPEFFRIAVRCEKENAIFLEALSRVLRPLQPFVRKRKKPAIMFQGTSSNAGKSVLTAALCRILLQDGLRVAPFKAQNMSLNSYVTHDGLEMGRAQVVQAQAARLDPDVRMNPVLLKPNSDTGSQVILRGKPVDNMEVFAYDQYKHTAMKEVCRCYDSLASDFDAVILEGAGSPGEVNLKKRDIVNMRMARYAESPVILVGDIDRGGIYASFVGTMEVFTQWERDLVAGYLVNRFRGDARLLKDAHDYVLKHTGKEVLGVIPYLQQHGIPEEDSVSFKEGLFEKQAPDCNYIEVVVVSLPHISNFTDIEPFVAEPDVHLRIVDTLQDIGTPDVLILPGSKNVISDLAAIRRSGIAGQVKRLAESDVEIVGICGGYQMLGRELLDPNKIESNMGKASGLGLLPIDTELAAAKTLIRREGQHNESGKPVTGYEIHHGQTIGSSQSLFTYDDGSVCGTKSTIGSIWGCYLHGLFDSDSFRRSFINRIRAKKGLPAYGGPLIAYDLEPAFDRLADTVREGLDMDVIYRLLQL